jgi:hypothetical protein
MKKEQYTIKERIIIAVFTIIFISPVFIVQGGPRIFYGVFVGAIGFAIGRKIVFYKRKKGKKEKRKKVHPLLSNFAIFNYVLVYVILSFIIDFKFLQEKLLLYWFKIIFSAYILFYSGLKQIQDKKGWLWGFPLTKKAALIYGILGVISALILMIFV